MQTDQMRPVAPDASRRRIDDFLAGEHMKPFGWLVLSLTAALLLNQSRGQQMIAVARRFASQDSTVKLN